MLAKDDYTHLYSSDSEFIDGLYEDYKNDPESVDQTWRAFFQGLEFQMGASGAGGDIDETTLRKEFNVFRLIQSFRTRGHLLSDTNPIRPRKNRDARISIEHYDLDESDLKKVFLCSEFVGLPGQTLENIINHLKTIYCGKIGIEYTHSNDTDVRRWVRNNFEKKALVYKADTEKQKQILRKLNEATVFEQFLQNKFIGQKRFSLEGGETTIPALDAMVNCGAENGAKEVVIGMAHRGRLNVLANILGKTYEFIFNEFEGFQHDKDVGSGDVKYHQGYTTVAKTTGGKEVTLKIMHNPSHLEAVDPVVQGYARAQADLSQDNDFSKTLPILVHGDAAVAGQGIVYEILQMSKLPAYNNGGTIHFVINNQIGFTTDYEDARSSIYCTSIAKAIDIPILHVNGDDPDAVVFACEFAVEFRQKFHQDIFIDMVCYRKHGHNEGDEPKYTQPHLYGLVAKHKNPREVYIESLISSGAFSEADAKQMQDEFKKMLSDRFNNVKQKTIPQRKKGPHREWLNLTFSKSEDFDSSPKTGVSKAMLEQIIQKVSTVPEDFKALKKALKILGERKANFDKNVIDWSLGELLAFGSILMEGNHIRFTGQDVIRGTFSHRHAKVFDEFTNEAYCGLEHLKDGQGNIYIYNSLLSEYAVLGFEYGYSLAYPHGLVIWEAQFGDFSNGAQIMIDQFISASEDKWRRMSGLIMLLPHGMEGQGPEHSSARLERYLQLTGSDNMAVLYPTTPGNHFHAFRRSLAWNFRKPVIIMTPKSLLRDPRCVSTVEDLTDGSFQEVIDDSYVTKSKVRRVLFCTGKVYYDLLQKQQDDKCKDVAIVRLEQLYPFPEKQVKAVISKYKNAELCWVQEEAMNMGTWTYLSRYPDFFQKLRYIGRPTSASPATGFLTVHKEQQETIVNESFK